MVLIPQHPQQGGSGMPTQLIVTPKFLTMEMANRAIDFAVTSVMESPALQGFLHPKRNDLHVVVLVPGVIQNIGELVFPDRSNSNMSAVVLTEKSFGDEDKFEHPYAEIALSKGLQLWTDRNYDGRTDCVPHLLFVGDTPYWGGVKRNGLVVACSGVQPWIDRLISGIVLDTLTTMAYQAWHDSEDRACGESFLT